MSSFSYVQRPPRVEAFKLFSAEESLETIAIPGWFMDAVASGAVAQSPDGNSVYIRTAIGTVGANVGDYIVKDSTGMLYPYKAEVFEELYQKEESQ